MNDRLMEFATDYYDLKSFPAGEAKRALERALTKKGSKHTSGESSRADEGREKKKRKKDRK